MQDEFHRVAMVVCRIILKPVIKLLLRYGLSFKEFCEIAKRVYVETAVNSLESGQNTSRIAVKTGVSRKEVSKILKSTANCPPESSIGILPLRIMSIWFGNNRFIDESGKPLRLKYHCDDGPSLSELIRFASADVPESAILKELISSGAVVESQGIYQAKSRQLIIAEERSKSIVSAGFDIAAMAETVIFNLENSENTIMPRFQQSAYSLNVSEENAIDFQRYMNKKAMQFLAKISNHLTNYKDAKKHDKKYCTGIGIYLFRLEIGAEFDSAFMDRLHVK